METTSDGITYYDSNGKAIALGMTVDGGGYGRDGKIVGFSAPDQNWGGVYVKWPEADEPEFQAASGSYDDETHTCHDVELAVCQGHPAEDCGREGEGAAIGDVLYCDGSCRG